MDSGKETTQITELKNLKKQLQWWRWSLFGVTLFVVCATIATVDGAVKGLTQKGPRQDQYISEVSTGLKQDVLPVVQDLVKQTVEEVKPEIQEAFNHVNSRLPEVAEKAMTEFEMLQTDLPKRGEKVLNTTFVAMLQSKESKLQEMFPEATEDQIERLLQNLASSCTQEASFANEELFSKHLNTLQEINRNLEKIHEDEKDSLAGVQPGWEMAVLVLDLFKEDVQNMRPDLNGAGLEASTMTDAIKVASPVHKEATKPSKPEKAPAPKTAKKVTK